MRLVLLLAPFFLVAFAAYAPRPTSSTPALSAVADSTEWENLHVLPDSLSRDELIGIMRGFARSLGVRCDHCHAREGEDLNFPSDANPHKEVARGMMRMTWQINEEILPAIEGLQAAAGRRVTCYTCHRGAAKPEVILPETEPSEPPPQPEHDHSEHDHGAG